MPYSNKQMLRDANGDLIPQYWDVVEQDFKPLTGQDGANDVRLTGSNVEKVVLFDAVAMNSEFIDSPVVDTSEYKSIYLLVRSSLNETVRFWMREKVGEVFMAFGKEDGEFTTDAYILRPHSAPRALVIDDSAGFRGNVPAKSLSFRVMATTIPNSGSITAYLVGVK